MIELVGTLIGGAGLGAVLTFFIQLRGSKRDDFSKVIASWEALAKKEEEKSGKLEERVSNLEQINLDLLQRINELETVILLHETSADDSPFPFWLKGPAPDFRMLYLNPAYEEAFLRPIGKAAEDYVGLTDFEFWEDQEQAQNYRDNDTLVWMTEGNFVGEEVIILKGMNVSENWRSGKWLRKDKRTRAKIGLAGQTFPVIDTD